MLRTCTACGQEDDQPRDVIGAVGTDAAPQNYHLRCHAAMGCRTCAERLAAVDRPAGADLRKQLLELTHGPLTDDQVAELVAGPAVLEENQHG